MNTCSLIGQYYEAIYIISPKYIGQSFEVMLELYRPVPPPVSPLIILILWKRKKTKKNTERKYMQFRYTILKIFTKRKFYGKKNVIEKPEHIPVYQTWMLKTKVIFIKIPIIFL